MLIDDEADLAITDPKGMTALDHARRMKQSSVVRLLESAEPPS